MRIAVYLGTFDPFHRGHEWVVKQCLACFDGMILLLPNHHFHKNLSAQSRASLEQRLAMVTLGRQYLPDKNIWLGWTDCILYLKLAKSLEKLYPQWAFHYIMGDETFTKVQNSANYYSRLHVPWGAQENSHLKVLLQNTVVLNRSGRNAAGMTCPPPIRSISSTRIRRLTGVITGKNFGSSPLLMGMLLPFLQLTIIKYIFTYRLYFHEMLVSLGKS